MFHNRKSSMKESKLEEKSTSRKYIKYPNNHLKTGLQVSESLTYAGITLLMGSHFPGPLTSHLHLPLPILVRGLFKKEKPEIKTKKIKM